MNIMWSDLDLVRMHTADANFDVKDAAKVPLVWSEIIRFSLFSNISK